MNRIAWSPDGRRVLVLHGGEIELRPVTGDGMTTMIPRRLVRVGVDSVATRADFADVRWLADGRIVSVDCFGEPQRFSMRGEEYAEPARQHYWRALTSLSIAAGGTRFAGVDRAVEVRSMGDRDLVWSYLAVKGWYPVRGEPDRAVLSPSGDQLAIASGDRWTVIDLRPNPKAERVGGHWRAEPLAQLDAPHLAFARDGRWIALDRPSIVDDAGIRIAAIVGDTKLLVRYADTGESIELDPDVGPIAAIAFGADDCIGCLTADGRVEIVPIP